MSDNTDQTIIQPGDTGYIGEDQFREDMIDGRIWIKTITAKSIGADPDRAKAKGAMDTGRTVLCCRIYGTVFGTTEVPSDPGKPDSLMLTVLIGEFRADVYNDDGEVTGFTGEWCGLPMGQNVIVGRLLKMREGGADSLSVSFDLEFAATPAGNPAGYRWLARNMMPVIYDRTSWLADQSAAARKRAALNAPQFPQFHNRDNQQRVIDHVAGSGN